MLKMISFNGVYLVSYLSFVDISSSHTVSELYQSLSFVTIYRSIHLFWPCRVLGSKN
jgi:hypothetical protein